MTRETLGTCLQSVELRGRPKTTPDKYPSGTLWPHGEWSLGWAKGRTDERLDSRKPWQCPKKTEDRIREDWALAQFPLDLSDAANSHTTSRRGSKGITGYGQQMVKAAGHLMGEYWPHHRKTLGTITLPPMSQKTRREVVAAWPEITRQLLQWQTRRLKRLGLPEAIVSVCEIQPKRLAESGEAVLHLHQLWLNVPAKSGHWSFSPNVIRSYLSRLLMRTCPSYTWGFINVDTRPVEGNAAAYLAKYMSKGRQALAEALEDWGEDNHPRTWWNMNKPTRDMVKAATHKGAKVGEMLRWVLDAYLDGVVNDPYAFLKPITHDFGKWEVIIGWRGRFESDVGAVLRTRAESISG